MLRIPRTQNPKAIALFLTSTIKLLKMRLLQNHEIVHNLAERLMQLASVNKEYTGWGYNFDWQALTGFAPKGTPNIICTTFAGHALLDAYEHNSNPRYLDMSINGAKFIHDHFNSRINDSESFYNYMSIEFDQKQLIPIHNANLLGASFLVRVTRHTRDEKMRSQALEAARYTANRQHDDGSWDYGEWDHPSQRWIDNFHTGFNLCAFRRIGQEAETAEFEPNVRRGFEFYQRNFFAKNSEAKYYHDRLYPIDIHSVSQSIITLVTFRDLDNNNINLADNVFDWAMSNMWSKHNYFYFQKYPFWTIRIPYMRWSQAWMLLALTVLEESRRNNDILTR